MWNFSIHLLLYSCLQPTTCCSWPSSLTATWSRRWDKKMARSARWRNTSPRLRRKSGTHAVTLADPPLLITFASFIALHSPCPPARGSLCYILISSCCHLSLRYHVFVRAQEFATAFLCSDLNPGPRSLYFSLTSMQIDRVQVFSCCSRLQSTHLGASRRGDKNSFLNAVELLQPPPRLSEILKLPCGCAELSFKSRPGSHEILPSHTETWLLCEMQMFYFFFYFPWSYSITRGSYLLLYDDFLQSLLVCPIVSETDDLKSSVILLNFFL